MQPLVRPRVLAWAVAIFLAAPALASQAAAQDCATFSILVEDEPSRYVAGV